MNTRIAEKILRGASTLSRKWFYVDKARHKMNGRNGWITLQMSKDEFYLVQRETDNQTKVKKKQ